MENSLVLLVWIVFFIAYGYLAATAWSWLVRRHVAFVCSGQRPSFSHDASVLAIALALGALPVAVLLLAGYWSTQQLSFGLIVFFCVSWAGAALPGIVRARRIMRAAGLDPDAA